VGNRRPEIVRNGRGFGTASEGTLGERSIGVPVQTVRFGHWLTRKVAYEAILLSERKTSHARVAEAMELRLWPTSLESSAAELPEDAAVLQAIAGEGLALERLAPAAPDLGAHWSAAAGPMTPAGPISPRRRAGLYLLAASWGAERSFAYERSLAFANDARGLLRGAGIEARIRANLAIASAMRRLGRYDGAGRVLEPARRALRRNAALLPKAISDSLMSTCLTGLAGVAWTRGRLDACVRMETEALGLARGIGDKRREAAALAGLGEAHATRGDHAAAIEAFRSAREVAASLRDTRSMIATSLGIASVLNATGQGTASEAAYRESLSLATSAGERRLRAVSLQGLGVTLEQRSRFPEAADCQREGLAIARQVGEPRLESFCLQGLGGVLSALGQYEEAKLVFDQALEIARRIRDSKSMGYALLGLGMAHDHLGRPAASIPLLDECLALFTSGGTEAEQSMARAVLSESCYRAGESTRATAEAKLALDAAVRLTDPDALIPPRIAAAIAFRDPDLATRAREVARSLNRAHDECRALLALADILFERGDPGAARIAAEDAATLARRYGMLGLLARAVKRGASWPVSPEI